MMNIVFKVGGKRERESTSLNKGIRKSSNLRA